MCSRVAEITLDQQVTLIELSLIEPADKTSCDPMRLSRAVVPL